MTDEEMFQKNVDLQTAFMQYTLDHPEILDQLPDDFRLVILPEDDPELARRNNELLKIQGDKDKPVVVVRMRTPKPTKRRVPAPKVEVLLQAS